ncbi:S8 family serine peptidase [Sodalis sp. RH15]|uniref:S8 family serine peptidase n=1 Tax=Sodalis sp. RH15 TaxID=3394330 RepID=UPI0039B46663
MLNINHGKIDHYAQQGVEYLYIVFKVLKKNGNACTYQAEAQHIKALLNRNITTCEVHKLLEKTARSYPANSSAVDEIYGFDRYFKVVLSEVNPSANHLNAILQLIAEQDFIESVYPAGKPVDASAGINFHHDPRQHGDGCNTEFITTDLIIPDFYQYQYYLSSPAYRTGNYKIGGIYVHGTWGTLGGDGNYVTILSYELSAWDTSHVNLPHERAFVQGAANIDFHDTASVGVAAARFLPTATMSGIVGIAYNARVAYAAWPIENIYNAYYQLNEGDVVQMGIQLIGGTETGCTADCYVPLEYNNAYYDIIRALTDKGVHVIIAAGNGAINLDHAAFNGKFNRNVRDSGAIYVGAIDPTTARRASFSNYGSRIDSSSWGAYVVTTFYGSGNLFNYPNAWYINNYGGTSSANPIVAGAAASLSSIAKANNWSLPPRLLRQIFTETGTVFQNNDSLIIGTQPNLSAALSTFKTIS